MGEKLTQALNLGTTGHLLEPEVSWLDGLEKSYPLSVQQLKIMAEWLVDARMWDRAGFVPALEQFIHAQEITSPQKTRKQKSQAIYLKAKALYDGYLAQPKDFSSPPQADAFPRYRTEKKELKGTIFRLCPAASERAVCCNMKVLNIVENCAMECSYCVLQNHYDEAVIKIPSNLKEKLEEIKLDPLQRYRICTGEYSDSLMWGNTNNILKDLCDFAARHPNIILEFKTKSANIEYFLKNKVPSNICLSWSLNPETVIAYEEQKTASLDRRLAAARLMADRGLKVAFHLHPMMDFSGWEEAYAALIQRLLQNFSASEVLWVSLGTVTLMKGFDKNVRRNYARSQILRMPKEETPDGKLTYPFETRKKLYAHALDHLRPWKNQVFQYLCMEHKPMWDALMDITYKNMGQFNDFFNDSAFAKLNRP